MLHHCLMLFHGYKSYIIVKGSYNASNYFMFFRFVYVICSSINKESRTFSINVFAACFTFLWFTNGLYVVEKTSGTSLFVYLLVVCESVWLGWPVTLCVALIISDEQRMPII